MMECSLRNVVESKTLEWIFVGGKGGVGKTTTSCSVAVALAESGRNTLVISTDPAHNLSDTFGQKFSKEPSAVRGMRRLACMEIEPPKNMGNIPPELQNALGAEVAQSFASMTELMDMIPGIDEAISFGALMEAVQRMDYDVIVFDTAPTGHTMRLLSFPSLLEKALGRLRELHSQYGGMLGAVSSMLGPNSANGGSDDLVASIGGRLEELEDIVRKVIERFRDSTKTTFVCVCIPEFLSVFETERLVQQLSKFSIDTHNVVVNQLIDLDQCQDPVEQERLFEARVAIQQRYLQQIEELYGEDFHVTKLPILSSEVRGRTMLGEFAQRILGEIPVDFGPSALAVESEYEPSLRNIIDQGTLKWIFVGGKGGVGKTTTSSAIAVAAAADRAKRNQRVLIVSTDPAHNLSDAFGQKISSGGQPTKLNGFDNLFALEVDPTSGAQSILAGVLPPEILPPGTIEDISSSIPGIDEAVSFAQIMKLVRTMDFALVIFDTAPTGHTLRLLQFPTLLGKGLEKLTELRDRMGPLLQAIAGPEDPTAEVTLSSAAAKLDELKAGLEEVTAVLRDSDRTTFVCVAIAEFLSVYETERLIQELATLEIDARNVVVNQLMPPREKDKIGLLRARASMQATYLAQIADLYPSDTFHVTRVPLLPREVRGIDHLKDFARRAVWQFVQEPSK
mmetsp:Transcript_6504/g.13027  ORF Transcript_6504/g.13027 Transcript_6504/m.13027 type:complete len:678 (-) Transcript_6504:1475-3508(-)